MLIHTACKNNVLADLSKMGWKLIADFCLRQEGNTFGAIDVIQPKNPASVQFYCQHCEKSLEMKEVQGVCSVCGNTVNLSDLYKIPDMWGDWCPSCKEKKGFGPNVGVPFSKLVSE